MININRNTKPYNRNILDYCMKSTQDSIRKIIKAKNLEKEKNFYNLKLFNNNYDNNDDDNRRHFFSYYNLLLFLSISSIEIYFYKKLK